MEEQTKKAAPAWLDYFRIGNRAFPAVLLLTLLAAAVAVWVLPFLGYVLGSGPLVPLTGILLVFSGVLIFRRYIFKSIHKGKPSDEDAALLEYLTHQNPAGTPEEEEITADLLENALHLKTLRAADCMAPRPEIVYIDVNSSVETLRQLFIESKLSRILVTEGELDHVLGYVHVQQLFEQPQSVRAMVMPITFVPEAIPVNEILNKFIRNRTSIACVVDEYGGLAGIVTLEDALEQLFGEIEDEHDQEEFIEAVVSPGEYILSGRLEIAYLNKKFPDLHLPEGDYTTLSGYLVTQYKNIPEQGARITLDGKDFLLELVSDRKIETVRVFLNPGSV